MRELDTKEEFNEDNKNLHWKILKQLIDELMCEYHRGEMSFIGPRPFLKVFKLQR